MATLRIASPCRQDWRAMTPSERGRHCAACDREVLDVVALPTIVARRAIAEIRASLADDPARRVCVHAVTDRRGRILSPIRRRLLTNAFAALLAMSIAGCAGPGPQVETASRSPTADAQVGQTPSSAASATLTAEPIPLPDIDLVTDQGEVFGQVCEGEMVAEPEPAEPNPNLPFDDQLLIVPASPPEPATPQANT